MSLFIDDDVCLTLDSFRPQIPAELQHPSIGIICGSGLGGLAHSVHDKPRCEVAYKDIRGFPRVNVTSAAGGLNRDYAVGDMVVLNDHLNLPGLMGFNPLRGPNADSFGVRFPALSDAYDLELRRTAHQAWKRCGAEHGRRLHEGVYAFVSGPTYETRAECRMLYNLGADVVGMSTVPEIVVARHCGLRVLALSLVTNMAVLDPAPRGDDPFVEGVGAKDLGRVMEKGRANHEEVIAESHHAAKAMQRLVEQIVADMDHAPSS
ncbi:MAG: hypothetical protein M1826_007245 [Phylliscum demangeonii]|nr:MAG: hypothetical protein M1826_007245 [Phylliscum demangeonii]